MKKWWFALCALLVLVGCSSRGEGERLATPPDPNTVVCTPDGQPCEFDSWCCPGSLCIGGACVNRGNLGVLDAGCNPQQVDLAIVIDVSGSMSHALPRIRLEVDSVLDFIPPTTEVQLWTTPSPRDGEYEQLVPSGPAADVAAAVADLELNDVYGQEATYDVVRHLFANNSLWRFGTTVRAVILITDEYGQSYKSPELTESTMCDYVGGNDKLFLYAPGHVWSHFDECATLRPLSISNDLGDVLVDPCRD